MDKFIGKALLQVHSDKEALKNKPIPTPRAPIGERKADIRNRIVFKQDTNKKIISLKERAQGRPTSSSD